MSRLLAIPSAGAHYDESHETPRLAEWRGLDRLTILRERGVLQDGILERGVVGLYMPEFDLDQPVNDYFASPEWNGIIGKWEGYVRAVVESKGKPPRLF